MRILIVWTGALVPAYRQFFLELARYMRVRALGPRRWTHGSVPLAGDSAPNREGNCEFLPTAFWPFGGSRYLVPSLALQLWRFRPRYLYLLEEMDRLTLTLHALVARLAWPPAKVVSYSLQNLPRPAYHGWHHALALRLNRLLVHRAITASPEAAEVLRGHGWRGPLGTVPLWGSESLFTPGDHRETAAAREALGIPDDAVVLVFAGSLVEAKGLRLLMEVLPRFPRLRLVAAGQGPLAAALGNSPQCITMGPLAGDALVRCYRLGDYVILPSVTTASWKEQIGRSLIEGVMCGAIALGSDSGYIPEVTLFAETTFRQGDRESLADLLARLPLAGADRIRAAQHANAMERFTASAAARRTWELLRAGAAPGAERAEDAGTGFAPSHSPGGA